MRVEPLKTARRRRKPALLFPSHRRLVAMVPEGTHTAQGRRAVEALYTKLKGHACYVQTGLLMLRETTGATSWTAHTWRGRCVRMTHEPSGCSVTSLRGALAENTDTDGVFSDLLMVLDWVNGYGVQPASIGAMAWDLWRASLARPVTIGFDPDVGRAALYGGRQQIASARVYRHMVAADITAAYPTEMAAHPYGVRLRPVSPSTDLDPTVAGLARARVVVPDDTPFPPLPIRLAPDVICFARGGFDSTWTWRELAAARELGFDVRVTDAWAPRVTADLFGPWWALVQQGRALPTPGARQLAKAIANATWGRFAMTGEQRGYTRWEDDRGNHPVAVELDPRSMPHRWAAHIAAETTARVRTRVLIEAIFGAAPGAPVHIDTDGVIIRRRAALPMGEGPGHWRVKAAMRKVDIRAPQLYRYQCTHGCGLDHPEWHYCAAGVPEQMAPAVFDSEAGHHVTTQIAAPRLNLDVVVPPTNTASSAEIAHWLTLAGSVR